MKLNSILLLTISTLLSSCEGFKTISGVVVSETTGRPLSSVEINILNNMGDSTITDSLGKYTIHSGFVGMMFGGPNFKFEVRKEGYEPLYIKTKYSLDMIRLKDKQKDN